MRGRGVLCHGLDSENGGTDAGHDSHAGYALFRAQLVSFLNVLLCIFSLLNSSIVCVDYFQGYVDYFQLYDSKFV